MRLLIEPRVPETRIPAWHPAWHPDWNPEHPERATTTESTGQRNQRWVTLEPDEIIRNFDHFSNDWYYTGIVNVLDTILYEGREWLVVARTDPSREGPQDPTIEYGRFGDLWEDMKRFAVQNPHHTFMCSDSPPHVGWTADPTEYPEYPDDYSQDPSTSVRWAIKLQNLQASQSSQSSIFQKMSPNDLKWRQNMLHYLKVDPPKGPGPEQGLDSEHTFQDVLSIDLL